MLNREKIEASLIWYISSVNEYGQKIKIFNDVDYIDITIKRFSNQLLPTNPIYNDVEYIGLTNNMRASEANDLLVNGVKYNILFTIKGRTVNELFLKKAKN